MVLFDSLYHIFQHPWQEISLASWRKYPNPSRPDVMSMDIINRHFDPETGVLTATRLLTTDPRIPGFLKPFWSNAVVYCVEESIVDPTNKTMTLRSRNITGSSLMEVEEVCHYSSTDEQVNLSTNFRQDVNIKAHVFGISGKIESWSLDDFKKNAVKGRVIMEEAVSLIKREAEDVEETLVTLKKGAGEMLHELAKVRVLADEPKNE